MAHQPTRDQSPFTAVVTWRDYTQAPPSAAYVTHTHTHYCTLTRQYFCSACVAGFEFSGCTSYALQDLINVEATQRPQWWWLLTESQGLSKCQPVEQMIISADLSKMKPNLTVEGRLPELPLAQVCVCVTQGHKCLVADLGVHFNSQALCCAVRCVPAHMCGFAPLHCT